MKEVRLMSQKTKLKNLDPLIQKELERTAKIDEAGRVLDGNGKPIENSVISVNGMIGEITGLATNDSVDSKVNTISENKIDKTSINQPDGVLGLNQDGKFSSELITDSMTQQSLNKTLEAMSNHQADSNIHVTTDEKLKIENSSQLGHKHSINDVEELESTIASIQTSITDTNSLLTQKADLNQVEELQIALDEKAPLIHTTTKVHESETHGMRVNASGKFEFFNGTDWVEGGSGGGSGVGREKFFELKLHKTEVAGITKLDIDTSKYMDVVIKFNQMSRHSEAADRTAYAVTCQLNTTGGATQHVKRAVNATTWSTSDNNGANIQLFAVKAPTTGWGSTKWSGEIQLDTLSFRYSFYSLFYNTGIYRTTPLPDGLVVETLTELYGGRTVTSEKYVTIDGKGYTYPVPLPVISFFFGTGRGLDEGVVEAWGIPHGK